jgi:hypothetical protein
LKLSDKVHLHFLELTPKLQRSPFSDVPQTSLKKLQRVGLAGFAAVVDGPDVLFVTVAIAPN